MSGRDFVHICTFSDPHDYRITDGKRVWFFDWSDRFGPSLTNGKGAILSSPYPAERSPFWRCQGLWLAQGKRSEAFGSGGYIRHAVWDEPPAGVYVIDERGLVLNFDEPDGFHDLYSERRFIGEDGSQRTPPRKPRGRTKLVITLTPPPPMNEGDD